MTIAEIFEAWAPNGARWSNWVKPVLFALLPEPDSEPSEPEPSDFELPRELIVPSVAFVVDLPGKDSVAAGLALARRGVRPVPLFNALPGGATALVDVSGIQQALSAGASALRHATLPLDAPPAFLLDSLRRTSRQRAAGQAHFDNRSLSFSTDFPSAQTLRQHGIERVALIRRWYLLVPGDLTATLAAWHAQGIAIEIHDVASERRPLSWTPPSLLWLHRFWFQTMVPLVLKREKSGAFGGLVRASG